MNKYEERYTSALQSMTEMNSRFRRPSKEYKAVYEALRQVAALQDQDFSAISPQMLEAQEKLNKACETYAETHVGARKTDRGKDRLDMINQVRDINQERYKEASEMATEVYGRDSLAWTKIAPVRLYDKPVAEKKGVNFAHAHEPAFDLPEDELSANVPTLEGDPEFKQIVEKSKGLKSTDFKPKEPDWNTVKQDASNEYRAKYEDMRKAAPKNPSENYKEVMKSLAQMVYITNASPDIKSPEIADAHAQLTKACVRYGVESDMKQVSGDGKKIAGLVDDVKNINKDFKNAMEGKLPEKKAAGKKEIPMSKLADKKAKTERKKSDAKKQETKKKAEKKQEPKKKEEKKASGISK